MMHAAQILVDILRNAWTAIIGLIVAVAVLAMLYQILKLSVDASLGASMYVAQAVGALIALVIVALYAFLAIPAIVRAVTVSVSISTACGPAAECGTGGGLCHGGNCCRSNGKSRVYCHVFCNERSGIRNVRRDHRGGGGGFGNAVDQRRGSSCGCIFGSLLGRTSNGRLDL